jgi:hypothetical protein
MNVLPQPLGPHTPSITGTRTPPSESARKFFTMCICGTRGNRVLPLCQAVLHDAGVRHVTSVSKHVASGAARFSASGWVGAVLELLLTARICCPYDGGVMRADVCRAPMHAAELQAVLDMPS